MRIAVLYHRGLEPEAGSPWDALLAGLGDAGHEAAFGGGNSGRIDALVALNDQPAVNDLQREAAISASRSALIAMEPRVTSPMMYSTRHLRRYGIRYAASPLWARSMAAASFPWPQELGLTQTSAGPSAYAATMIIGDKRSAVAGSLYGLRRQVIREFARARTPLAVFGPGWNAPVRERFVSGGKACAKAVIGGLPPRLGEAFGGLGERPEHWLGRVEDKSTAFAVAPVSIVIENSADYVSEKLVDALRGGVVPIYVGPTLADFGFPPGLALECPPSASAILRAIATLDEEQHSKILAAGRAWLASDDAQSREMRRVLYDLGVAIGRQLQ